MRIFLRTLLIGALLLAAVIAKAQVFTNDFENRNEWLEPWLNLHIVPKGDSLSSNHVCLCDSVHEYGLGFSIDATIGRPRNISCRFACDIKSTDSLKNAAWVISIENGKFPYWQPLPLTTLISDTTAWQRLQTAFSFPADYLGAGQIKCYFWNPSHETLFFDNAELEVKTELFPIYQPEIERDSTEKWPYLTPVLEYINARGDTLSDLSTIQSNIAIETDGNRLTVKTETRFKEDVKLLRLAFILPLPDGNLTVYRRNQYMDTTNFQTSYYLNREGFAIKNDSLTLCTYHNKNISSLQLDVENRTACFNIDYWRDHPLLHYPMRTDTSDYFEDISFREVKAGETIEGEFTLYLNAPEELPRLMPVWDGYQSAFIFTEHADWTDLRTHRAVLFGNENITKPEDAVGGFCYFDIPVTKSVFYWNPDNVTNDLASKGNFFGLHATIQTDKEFYKLLKTIKKRGFEICLHSPEQYTTIPSEFPKAMRFMRRNFNTVSWIDHGYNNGPDKNRENMVCDGLLPDSPYYSADLWRKNGVRYLWNAYYEENRMEDHNFDGHFVQPYDGFGDALPNRQITTLPNGDPDFLLWSTPSTLEVNEDHEWYYYFDSIRLQRLVDQHNVFITHIYPAWTDPWRGFWQYNENGTVVAMPGFNFALSQLARFRDEKKILPTTIEKYLSYYEKLQNLDYLILDNKTIQLTNPSEAIEGLTLLCTKPIIVEGKVMDFRKVDEGYLVWFNLGKKETVTIRYRE